MNQRVHLLTFFCFFISFLLNSSDSKDFNYAQEKYKIPDTPESISLDHTSPAAELEYKPKLEESHFSFTVEVSEPKPRLIDNPAYIAVLQAKAQERYKVVKHIAIELREIYKLAYGEESPALLAENVYNLIDYVLQLEKGPDKTAFIEILEESLAPFFDKDNGVFTTTSQGGWEGSARARDMLNDIKKQFKSAGVSDDVAEKIYQEMFGALPKKIRDKFYSESQNQGRPTQNIKDLEFVSRQAFRKQLLDTIQNMRNGKFAAAKLTVNQVKKANIGNQGITIGRCYEDIKNRYLQQLIHPEYNQDPEWNDFSEEEKLKIIQDVNLRDKSHNQFAGRYKVKKELEKKFNLEDAKIRTEEINKILYKLVGKNHQQQLAYLEEVTKNNSRLREAFFLPNGILRAYSETKFGYHFQFNIEQPEKMQQEIIKTVNDHFVVYKHADERLSLQARNFIANANKSVGEESVVSLKIAQGLNQALLNNSDYIFLTKESYVREYTQDYVHSFENHQKAKIVAQKILEKENSTLEQFAKQCGVLIKPIEIKNQEAFKQELENQKNLAHSSGNTFLAQRYQDRIDAINHVIANPYQIYTKKYLLSSSAIDLLCKYQIDYKPIEDFTGSAIQHQVHSEFVELLNQINTANKIRSDVQFNNAVNSSMKFGQLALALNQEHKVEEAFTLLDFCKVALSHTVFQGVNTLLHPVESVECLLAFGKGVYNSVSKTGEMIMHPIETVKMIGNVASTILDIAVDFVPDNLVTYSETDLNRIKQRASQFVEVTDALYQQLARAKHKEICEFLGEFVADVVTQHYALKAIGKTVSAVELLAKATERISKGERILEGFGPIGKDIAQVVGLGAEYENKVVQEAIKVTLEEKDLVTKGQMFFQEVENIAQKTNARTFSTETLAKSHGEDLYNFTETTMKRMSDPKRMIPVHIIDDIIKFPLYVAKDPQGSHALMYYAKLWKNSKLYNVEILYDKTNNRILHFLYSRQALGPLSEIKNVFKK